MILHLDLDCFFAAAHRINNIQLHNIPIAVGSKSDIAIFDNKKTTRHLSQIEGAFTSSLVSSNNDKTFEEYFLDKDKNIKGIITTSSYEARNFGVKTAMSVSQALQLCPTMVVIPPDYPLYHQLSNDLKKLLEKEIPVIEQFSIDEFFGDVTGWIDDKDIVQFSLKLQAKILKSIGLPISIGLAKTKWIAKLATNYAKPYGVRQILPEQLEEFIKDMKVEQFPGIGKKFQEKLRAKGITKLSQIKLHKDLFYSWGKFGKQIYNRVQGIDKEKISLAQSKKSIGLGRSFDPILERDEIRRRISILCRHLSFIAHKGNHNPLTFALNIKYQYGLKVQDSINTNRLFSEQNLKDTILDIFDNIDIHLTHYISQININLSNFKETKLVTLDILNYNDDKKQSSITKSMQKLRDKFGVDIIKNATEIS